ncbi:TVP38/TMEM64 family protein [Hoeflea sp.]|uniref:TVP38/TMEM64 family protein n=1 Tax=Hoeflea sp. TaxID=1940281 RepID=UPI003BB0BD99
MTTHSPSSRMEPSMAGNHETERDTAKPVWKKFLPIGVVAVGLGAGYAAGLQDYLSLSALANQRDTLKAFVADHRIGSALGFVVLYALAVAFSFPAASILTIFSGFLFGWLLGGALTAVAATLGATAIFLAAQSAFGDVLRKRAGPFAAKLADGFAKDAFGYLFVLRLAPVFPFFIMNIAPAFFDIRLRTYVSATFLGILPGTFAYAWLGQGLDSVIVSAAEAGREVSIADLVTPQITIAFAGLAIVAAIPTIIRKLRARKTDGA